MIWLRAWSRSISLTSSIASNIMALQLIRARADIQLIEYSKLVLLESWDILESVDAMKNEDEGSHPLGTIDLILPSLILILIAPSLLWKCNVLFLQSWRATIALS